MRLGQIRSLVKPQFVLPFHPRLTLVRGATAELPQQIEQGIAGAGNGPIDGEVRIENQRLKFSAIPAGLIGDDETLILRADDLHAALHAILTEHRNEVVDDLKRLDDRSAHAGRQVSVFGARRTELDERLAANDRETAMLNAKRTQRQEIALDVTEARSILAALASARSEAQTVPLAALALAQAWSDFEARREGALTAASSLHVDGPHELSPFDPEVAKEVHRLHGEVEDAKEAAAGNRARRGKRQLAEAERLLNEYLDRFGFRSYLTYVLAISTDDEGSAQSRELARSLRDQRAADAERRRVEQLESLALDFERQRRHLRDETLALMGSEPEGDPIEALRAYREPSPKIAGLHVQLVTFLRLRGIDVDMERGDDPDALAASWLARQAALLTSGHPDAAAELERDLADAARARSAISAEHLETRTALDRANAESERLRVDALALRTELAKIERREAEAAASGGAASTTPAELDEVLRRSLTSHPWPDEIGPLPLLIDGALEVFTGRTRDRAEAMIVGLSEEAQVVIFSSDPGLHEWVEGLGAELGASISIEAAIELEQERVAYEAGLAAKVAQDEQSRADQAQAASAAMAADEQAAIEATAAAARAEIAAKEAAADAAERVAQEQAARDAEVAEAAARAAQAQAAKEADEREAAEREAKARAEAEEAIRLTAEVQAQAAREAAEQAAREESQRKARAKTEAEEIAAARAEVQAALDAKKAAAESQEQAQALHQLELQKAAELEAEEWRRRREAEREGIDAEGAHRRRQEAQRRQQEEAAEEQMAEEAAAFEKIDAQKVQAENERQESLTQAREAKIQRGKQDQADRLAAEAAAETLRRSDAGLCESCGKAVGPTNLVAVGKGRKRKSVCIDCALVLAGVRSKSKRRSG